MIVKKEKSTNTELFQKHFKFPSPSLVLKTLHNVHNKERNNELENKIKSGLSGLKDEFENIYEDEERIKQPDRVVGIVVKILNFKNQNKKDQGLKILTQDQMFSRLTITLAQVKAGYNSEKLNNEIKQPLYSLYRSKKLIKTTYNNLINTI